jgi:hypothetical protein
MKLPAAEARIFKQVMNHYQFDPAEVELWKSAYRADPEAGRICCQALFDEFNPSWREAMSKGLTEKIREQIRVTNDFKRLKELLLKKDDEQAASPGQPEPPLNPPPPKDDEQHYQQPPTRRDPPQEAA